MIYDFDKPVDRSGSNDVKHAALREMFGREDLIPLWVADMDWETPDFVMEALRRRLDHAVLGYTADPVDYWPTVINWLRERHGWQVEQEWMTYIPGIVKGIGMVINAMLGPEDKVVVQPPVYHPFRWVPEGNRRVVVDNPLRRVGDRYEMDLEGLTELLDNDPSCRLLIVANPHNPIGICWSRETLQQVAHICHQRGVLVISDEIHCDMALWGHRHIPFASVSDEAAQCSITFGAPSKTFNIAGVVSSWAIVPNAEIRQRFFDWIHANEMEMPTLFAPIATIAALTQGEEWRQQMLRYVEGNIELVENYCREHIPAIRVVRPEASYLVWLDCTALGLSHDELIDLFVNKARLALNDGAMFGQGGEGYMRLNVGTQRAVLQQALEQLRSCF